MFGYQVIKATGNCLNKWIFCSVIEAVCSVIKANGNCLNKWSLCSVIEANSICIGNWTKCLVVKEVYSVIKAIRNCLDNRTFRLVIEANQFASITKCFVCLFIQIFFFDNQMFCSVIEANWVFSYRNGDFGVSITEHSVID